MHVYARKSGLSHLFPPSMAPLAGVDRRACGPARSSRYLAVVSRTHICLLQTAAANFLPSVYADTTCQPASSDHPNTIEQQCVVINYCYQLSPM